MGGAKNKMSFCKYFFSHNALQWWWLKTSLSRKSFFFLWEQFYNQWSFLSESSLGALLVSLLIKFQRWETVEQSKILPSCPASETNEASCYSSPCPADQMETERKRWTNEKRTLSIETASQTIKKRDDFFPAVKAYFLEHFFCIEVSWRLPGGHRWLPVAAHRTVPLPRARWLSCKKVVQTYAFTDGRKSGMKYCGKHFLAHFVELDELMNVFTKHS